MFFFLNNFFLFIAVILESIYYAFNHLFYLGDILAWYYAADKFLISQSFMAKALWTECLNTRKKLWALGFYSGSFASMILDEKILVRASLAA